MSTLCASKQEKLDALRRALAERLPGIVAEVEAACREALALPADAATLERAVRGSHTLAGTAGTFGYLELGRTARSLELLFRGGTAAAAAVEDHFVRMRRALP